MLGLSLVALIGLPSFVSAGTSNTPDVDFFQVDGIVYSLAHDAATNTLYVGGNFTKVFKYSGSASLISKSAGVRNSASLKVNGSVKKIISDGAGGYYLAGEFTKVGSDSITNLAHINANNTLDTSFTPNPDGVVYDILLDGANLYVAGYFSNISGVAQGQLALINASTGAADLTFNPVFSNAVTQVEKSGANLYIVGNFTTIGGAAFVGIAKLAAATGVPDPTFDPNPTGSKGEKVAPTAITLYNSSVYISGSFLNIGGQSRVGLAKVDPDTGAADVAFTANCLDSKGTPAVITSIEPSGSSLYLGGFFATVGGQTRNGGAKISMTDGAVDATFDPNLSNGTVNTVVVDGSDVYFGGAFLNAGGGSFSKMVKVSSTNGVVVESFSPQPSGEVRTILPAGDQLYVGGDFANIGGGSYSRNAIFALNLNTNQILSFDSSPSAWASVYSLLFANGSLYVAGNFADIGGQTITNLAKLNPTTGAADPTLSFTFTKDVSSLVRDGNYLYASGPFTGSAGTKVVKINLTDNTADLSFAPTITGGEINALAVYDSNVIIGGSFTNVNGAPRNGIAKLNAAGELDATFNPDANDSKGGVGSVFSLLVNGSNLYVGGNFVNIGGGAMPVLARINPTTGVLDTGFTTGVAVGGTQSLYASGDYLYVGQKGSPYTYKSLLTTGTPDATFTPGLDAVNYAAFLDGEDLYLGGNFSNYGITPIRGLAKFPSDTPPDTTAPTITILGDNPYTLYQGTTYVDPGATASDNVDGNITANITRVNGVNSNVIGSYSVTYNVSDASLNAATEAVRTVKVVANPANGSGGGSLPAAAFLAPREPAGGFQFQINNGQAETNSSAVSLNFVALPSDLTEPIAYYVAVSNNPEFVGASLDAYQNNKSWVLSPGSGEKTVYVKFYNRWGKSTEVFSDSIKLTNNNPIVGNQVGSDVVVSPAPSVCRSYLTKQIIWGARNDKNEVLKLQKFLKEKQGQTKIKYTGVYDYATLLAVRNFQTKYAKDILVPNKLKRSTGQVSFSTLKKINALVCSSEK